MAWQLLLAISVLFTSVSVLMQRMILKHEKVESISFSIYFQLCVAFVASLIILITKGKIEIPNFSQIFPSVLVMAVLYALGNIAIFSALARIEASKFTVLFSLKTLFAVVIATVLFSQGLNWVQWVGAILLIGGVIIVSSKNTKFTFDRGEIYAILAALLFAFANINDVFLLKHFDPYSYVVFGFLLPGLLLCVIYPKKISLIRPYFSKELFYKIILLSIIYGINAIAFFAALQIVPNVSQLFTMNSISVVVTVILAIIFLKENNSLIRKLFGSCLSVIGLILVK